MTARETHLAARLRRLGDEVIPVEEEAIVAARRRRIVHRMEANLRGVGERRVRRTFQSRIFAVCAAVALAAASYVVIRIAANSPSLAHIDEIHGSAHLRHRGGDPMAISGPRALPIDDEIAVDAEGGAHMTSAVGASIDLDGASIVRAVASSDSGEAFFLTAGRVVVKVPKLGASGTFRVRTSDAEIVVHGTAFRVSACDRCGGDVANTRVRVEEGVVSVWHAGQEAIVRAGGVWPNIETTEALPVDSAAPTVMAPDDAPPVAPSSPRAVTSIQSADPGRSGSSTAASAPPETSSLAAQNVLLQSAFAARRRGDPAGALGDLDKLLSKYPSSPLAQEARVERLRCLETMGKGAAAAAEARRYLVDYPDGFARDEAKARALPPLAPSGSARP